MYNLYIPLISRVRGPYGKLWTEFFSFLLWPKLEARGVLLYEAYRGGFRNFGKERPVKVICAQKDYFL